MVKKIKYFLIIILIVLLFFIIMFSVFEYKNIHYGSQKTVNVKENHYLGVDSKILSTNSSFLLLKQKVYLGLPFEAELMENSHIFTSEDLESLRFFSLNGIKNGLQIKKDFIHMKYVIFTEESFIKNFILKHIMYVSNLINRKNIEKISDALFIDEYNAAIHIANMLYFVNYDSMILFSKWKKDLEDYVTVDDVMKKYL